VKRRYWVTSPVDQAVIGQVTGNPDFSVPMENQPLVIRPVLLDEGLGDFSNR
jgi:hypothetical protein